MSENIIEFPSPIEYPPQPEAPATTQDAPLETCGACAGVGRVLYPTPAGFMEDDVEALDLVLPEGAAQYPGLCDTCWGSGLVSHPFANLRGVFVQARMSEGYWEILNQHTTLAKIRKVAKQIRAGLNRYETWRTRALLATRMLARMDRLYTRVVYQELHDALPIQDDPELRTALMKAAEVMFTTTVSPNQPTEKEE